MPACPVTIHALLHIADRIEFVGPVWCYWAFPMERYCNRLKPAIRSRRFPYASLDRFVLEDAQLTQIKAIYNLSEELALRPPRHAHPIGSLAVEECKSDPLSFVRWCLIVRTDVILRFKLYPVASSEGRMLSGPRYKEVCCGCLIDTFWACSFGDQ